MSKLTKKQKALQGKIESTRLYPLAEALTLVKDAATAKFDESIDVAVQLGVDAKKSDQVVRGAVVLPNAAVRHVDGRTGVWTVAGGALRFAPVRLGALGLDGEVQVLEGVAPGTTVVVHSEKELGAGSRFEVVPSLAGAPR